VNKDDQNNQVREIDMMINNNWHLTLSDVIYNHNVIMSKLQITWPCNWVTNYKLQITNYTKANCNL